MIDWKRAESLKNDVGDDAFEEVIALFLEETETAIEKLKTATNRAALEADLHFLKGSALTLGFTTFSALCQAGESAAAQGEAEQVDLTKILETFAMSKEVFLSELSQNIAA